MKTSKRLVFSPTAWAKIKWMMKKAGKLEISGFGISAEDNPLQVIDFQTILQECDTTETLMDNDDLAKYQYRMAKAGIDPCRSMRIWIHSHPFSTSSPSPSGTDEETLLEKTGADSEWAIMVIMGKGDPYIRLQLRNGLLGDEAIGLEMEYEIDWSMIVSKATIDLWETEFDLNIHEAAPIVVAHQTRALDWWQKERKASGRGQQKFTPSTGQGYPSAPRGPAADAKHIAQYRHEWMAFNFLPGGLDQDDYVRARFKGYTIKEVLEWGEFTLVNPCHVLRNSNWEGVTTYLEPELKQEQSNGKKSRKRGKKK